MKRLLLVALVTLGLPGVASAAPMFGFSTENPDVFRTVAREMPVQIYAPFIQFRHANEFNLVLTQARVFHKTPMISWETWDPQYKSYAFRSHNPAPGLSDAQIATGSQDRYIKRQASFVKAYHGLVYIRFDHEMNGYWYPWSFDHRKGAAFVRMWHHVWNVFHKAGVTNVRWVWSPNLNTYESDGAFDARIRAFWPGAQYVDIVGGTVTRLLAQGAFYSGPAWFFQRLDRMLAFNKPMWVTESLVDLQEMPQWMPGFRQEVDSRPWIKAVIWLSTSGSQQADFGNMNWLLSDQPLARHYLTWKKGFKP
jgi:hypothetical protein